MSKILEKRSMFAVFAIAATMIFGMTATQTVMANEGEEEPHIELPDAQFVTMETVVLKGPLKAGDFLLLADANPLQIVGGHVAMNVPCEDEMTDLVVLAGAAEHEGSTVVPVELEDIHDLSDDKDCLYHADLDIEHIIQAMHEENDEPIDDIVVTDIALLNGGDKKVKFGADNDNSIVVTLLLAEGAGHHE